MNKAPLMKAMVAYSLNAVSVRLLLFPKVEQGCDHVNFAFHPHSRTVLLNFFSPFMNFALQTLIELAASASIN
jgi:hypothetical protein